DGAWLAAVACATENRYNSIAVMYLKMLFPFAKARDLSSIAPSNTLTAQPEPEVQAEEAAIEPQIAIDQPLELAPAPENAPLPLSGTFPEGWERVLKEDCLAALRLDQKGEIANHGADLSGLIPLLHWLEKDLFSRTQMGQLHHAAFDGSARMLHHWGRGGDHLTALVDAGPQAAVLAARLGKAFHDLAENDA
ncbi:MAG: hypothetical protein RL318_2958, partial [Fibrobacterota bacterium]